jgi:hypothetical protein
MSNKEKYLKKFSEYSLHFSVEQENKALHELNQIWYSMTLEEREDINRRLKHIHD